MVTKAELEAVMTAFHAKFEQLQVETDRKIAHSQEELVCVIIEQVNQHATSSREQLYMNFLIGLWLRTLRLMLRFPLIRVTP
jgi:hypothetical protein